MTNLFLYIGPLWTPPVGLFSAVLAVLSMVLAILELKGWHRWSVLSLSALLFLGEVYAIVGNDKAHAREVKELNKQIESQPQKTADILKGSFDKLESKISNPEQKKLVDQAKADALMKLKVPNISPDSLDKMSIDDLRLFASNTANKMYSAALGQNEEDEHCFTSESVAPNLAEKQRIESECREKRKQFDIGTVGLVSDGNLFREAMIHRIGPVSEDWRKPFTRASTQNADVLRQMVKKLGGGPEHE